MNWKRPSPRVRELIRQGAQITVNARPEWLDELDRATLASIPTIAGDPVLAAAISRTNRANLMYWSTANLRDPGAPVPANLGPEPLGSARDLVRRGLELVGLDAYRVGESVAWRRWMEIAFELTSDPAELQELLDVSSRSISAFIEATVAGIAAQIEVERDELTRGTYAERRQVVALILDGAPISRQRAEARLGYPFNRPHTAAIIWTDTPERDLRHLDRTAEAFAHAAGSLRPLNILASSASRWVWVAGTAAIDVGQLLRAIDQVPDVRVAIGRTLNGIEGFRRSHLDALTTQRMLAQLSSAQRVAFFSDVQLAALMTHDPEGADEFITQVLGDFESASAELRAAVLTFVNEQCNASRAAERLHTHRSTLLRRLARANALLPRPLDETSVRVAVALEALRWRGNHSNSAR
jgi:DNA-binding PucR family transcriptional regulator